MKRRGTILLLGIVALWLLPAAAQAQEQESSETDFTYVATDDGRIVVRRVAGVSAEPVVVVGGHEGGARWIGPWEGRGFLGVHVIELTAELRRHFGAPEEEGVMISKIAPDSAAAEAGLRVGDILTQIAGQAVVSRWEVVRQVRRHEPGETVDLQIWRQGKPREIAVTLTESDRYVVDFGELVHPGAQGFIYDIDTEAVGRAIERLKETVGDPAWRERALRLKTLDEDLQQRLQGLEKRIEELERQLER